MRALSRQFAALSCAGALSLTSCSTQDDGDTTGTATGSVASEAEARSAIREQGARIVAFWPAENIDSILPIFAEDAAMMFPDVPDVRGTAAIREFLGTAFGMASIESLETEIDTIEVFDDVAYEWGRYRERMTETGKSQVQTDGRYLMRWARQADGTWRVTRFTGNTEKKTPTATAAR